MKRLLLDTHALLWYAQGASELPGDLVQLIQQAGNNCFISRASLWEVAIKSSLGKLVLPGGFGVWQARVRAQGFALLEISDEHLQCLHGLPYHRRDPFDRLPIAQALTENLTLVSRDTKFANYSLSPMW